MGSETSSNLKKVEIEINFWYGGNGNVGHVSLYIPEVYLYISYWPENTTKGFKSVPSATNTYAEDVREQEREADYVLKASINLDLNAMEKFWNDAQKRNYSFIGNNCSDVVLKVLEAGNVEFREAQPNLISPTMNSFPQTMALNQIMNLKNEDFLTWSSIRAKISEFRMQGFGNALRK